MHKVSHELSKRFFQDPLETYFHKHHPPGARKDNLPLYDFGYENTFWNQLVFKPIVTGSVRDKKINFELGRTSSMSRKMQKKNNPCDLQKFQAPIRYLTIKTTQQVS